MFVFDLDGVIIDSIPLHVESMKYALSKLGYEWKDELIKKFGLRARDIIADYGMNEQTYKRFIDIKVKYLLDHMDEIKLMPGFLDVVNYLKPKYKLAIASMSTHVIQYFVEKFQLNKYFDIILDADGFNPRPDPGQLLTIAERWNIPTEQLIYIGDTVWDVKTARKVNALCFALAGTVDKEELKDAHFVFESLSSMLDFIKEKESITKESVLRVLSDLRDPEVPRSITDLNIVSKDDIKIIPGRIIVEFTPTIPFCPLGGVIGVGIKYMLEKSFGVNALVRVKPGAHAYEHDINTMISENYTEELEKIKQNGLLEIMLSRS